jgi:SAM-dependent methyltransferase
MTFDALLGKVERYYSARFADHGATPAGVDWNGPESQSLRFRELLRVTDGESGITVLDYGCGYGALAAYLADSGRDVDYVGYDVSESMVEHARRAHGDSSRARFTHDQTEVLPADYAIASGIFNVKLDEDDGHWHDYVVSTMSRLAELGKRGFAFNMLTGYSDPGRMRPDLYYGDPGRYFDLCKRTLAGNVALLHDYGLWEFTILARHEPRRG